MTIDDFRLSIVGDEQWCGAWRRTAMNGRAVKALRKVARERMGDAHREVWLALCAGPWRKRWILAARLVCGKPFGVWKRA